MGQMILDKSPRKLLDATYQLTLKDPPPMAEMMIAP